MTINAVTIATIVTRAAHAKGGRSKAKEVTIAQASEVVRLTLQEIAALPACEVGRLLAKYAPKPKPARRPRPRNRRRR